MLGVVGESAAGKTTLTRGLARLLGGSGVTPLCLDDYHRYDRVERARLRISASDPDANYLDRMATDLAALRAGNTISKPIYDHRQGSLRGPEAVAATGLVIAYGMLTLTPPAVAELFDLTVYLDPDPALLRRWRFERDVNERGYTPAEVEAHEIPRAQDAQRFIVGQRARADLVIRFRPGAGDRLGVTALLRRHAPAFDWGLLSGAGITIDPAVVDDDGCTSTVLQIAPTANPADLINAQFTLWSSLPLPPEPLDPARLADDPATAFVQTFVAYHLLRTRLHG
jgi:phosphoribulokinase